MGESWTIKKLLDWSETYFESHQIEEGRLNAQWLLSHVLKVKRMDLFLQFDRELIEQELKDYKALIVRRIKHEPLQYIMGEADFMGRLFTVSPSVLIPRLDTEVLAEQALSWLKTHPVDAVLDVGTGSGILAITVALAYPDLPIMAVDISPEALEVATENATKHNVPIHFELGTWPILLSDAKSILVISNPPYIAESVISTLSSEVKEHEPTLALSGGADGLDVIRQIIDNIRSFGREVQLMMEIGYDQGRSVSSLLAEANFSNINIIPDYEGRDRVVVGTYSPT